MQLRAVWLKSPRDVAVLLCLPLIHHPEILAALSTPDEADQGNTVGTELDATVSREATTALSGCPLRKTNAPSSPLFV